jgi:sugar/nucleoside kinase (ribokinase family)
VIFSTESLRATTGERDLAAGVAQIQRLTQRFVSVTEGSNDIRWSTGGPVQAMPAFRVDAVDTLAAGDIFHGGFAIALIEGRDLVAALRFGAAAAAIKCTRFGGGATAPTRAEVEAFLARN